MCARVAEAVNVGHGDARGVGQVQVLVRCHAGFPLQVCTPLQPLQAHHVAVRPHLGAHDNGRTVNQQNGCCCTA